MHPSGDVTRLLAAWTSGDQQALDGLMPLVYGELHRIARRCWVSQPAGHTLQPTALIHEAYLKLVNQGQRTFQSRTHFSRSPRWRCAKSWSIMPRPTWRKSAEGGKETISIEDIDPALRQEAREVLSLHEALKELDRIDPRKSRVVELRYFGGLSIEETAEALGVSTITVTRDFQAARAWLARELGAGNAAEP